VEPNPFLISPSDSSAGNMCHLSYIRHGCQHLKAVQLFCHRPASNQTCGPKNQRVVAAYYFRGECFDCATRRWFNRESQDLEVQERRFSDLTAKTPSVTMAEMDALVANEKQRIRLEDRAREALTRQEYEEIRLAHSWATEDSYVQLAMTYPVDAATFKMDEASLEQLQRHRPGTIVCVVSKNSDVESEEVTDEEVEGIQNLIDARRTAAE